MEQVVAVPPTWLGPIVKGASTALEASHVLKASAGILYRLTVNNHLGAASWVMIFDATAVPGDGAVTPAWAPPCPAAAGGADGLLQIDFGLYGLPMASGIVVVLSSTGPFTKTASANAGFFWEIQ